MRRELERVNLAKYADRREWTLVLGSLLFVVLMSAGYYCNLTFVQLGLFDLGTHRAGMSHVEVSVGMGLLAFLALAVALVTGGLIDHRSGTLLYLGAQALLKQVPVVGALAGLILLATGVGAVLVTYLGFRRFEPELQLDD